MLGEKAYNPSEPRPYIIDSRVLLARGGGQEEEAEAKAEAEDAENKQNLTQGVRKNYENL